MYWMVVSWHEKNLFQASAHPWNKTLKQNTETTWNSFSVRTWWNWNKTKLLTVGWNETGDRQQQFCFRPLFQFYFTVCDGLYAADHNWANSVILFAHVYCWPISFISRGCSWRNVYFLTMYYYRPWPYVVMITLVLYAMSTSSPLRFKNLVGLNHLVKELFWKKAWAFTTAYV